MMARRLVVRRRYAVAGLALLASTLYWAGVWLWVEGGMRRATSAGEDPVTATLHANAQALQATWAWVVALVVLHGAAGGLAAVRRDRELGIGMLSSALLHLGWALAQGVLKP